MVFYVATIVKIYDHRYFQFEVGNEVDVEKVLVLLLQNKILIYLMQVKKWIFNNRLYRNFVSFIISTKHKLKLTPPSDWKKSNKFSWSKNILLKNSKLASVDMSRKNINHVHTGMKLEAVDPLNSDRIRVATVKGFADHWMFLSFDSINW